MRLAMVVIAVLCCAGSAVAEDVEETADESQGSSESEANAESESDATTAADSTGAPAEAAAVAGTPPAWWLGAYAQGAFVPSFMLKLFLDEAPTVANVNFGLIATHRDKSGFSLVLGLGYASYGFEGPFRISGDPEQDTEFLSSTLKLLHLRGEMLWSTELVPNTLSFEYGIGLDLGVVIGELRRSEAFRASPGADFQPCLAPGVPPATVGFVPYCEPPTRFPSNAYNEMGAHYNVVEKRVPPVALIPMLPVLALRYTPIRQLALKFDFAFGLMQFAVGLSAAYGLDT